MYSNVRENTDHGLILFLCHFVSQGVTAIQTLKAPFRKSALFSTPIRERLDEIDLPPDNWDSTSDITLSPVSMKELTNFKSYCVLNDGDTSGDKLSLPNLETSTGFCEVKSMKGKRGSFKYLDCVCIWRCLLKIAWLLSFSVSLSEKHKSVAETQLKSCWQNPDPDIWTLNLPNKLSLTVLKQVSDGHICCLLVWLSKNNYLLYLSAPLTVAHSADRSQ